jgi:DNA-binding GntR family transcriptional regulator
MESGELVTASVAEQAVKALRTAIVRGDLKAGRRYTTDDLAQKYGVSRTPVREALVRLSEAGFVAVEPKVGFRVIKPSVRDVQQLFQMRLMLEVPAAYHAAGHKTPIDMEALEGEFLAMDKIAKARAEAPASNDDESRELDLRYVEVDTHFHELILEASGNRRLALEVRKLRHNTSALGVWRLSESRRDKNGRLEKGLLKMQKEHKALLDAMKRGDQAGAARAMYDHLLETGTLLMEELEKDDEGTFDRDWSDGVVVPDH